MSQTRADIAGVIGWNADAAVGVANVHVGIAGTVRDPDAATGTHDRVERVGQSAGRTDQFNLAVVIAVNVRLAIGDHDQFRSAEARPSNVLEAFLAPAHLKFLSVSNSGRNGRGDAKETRSCLLSTHLR